MKSITEKPSDRYENDSQMARKQQKHIRGLQFTLQDQALDWQLSVYFFNPPGTGV